MIEQACMTATPTEARLAERREGTGKPVARGTTVPRRLTIRKLMVVTLAFAVLFAFLRYVNEARKRAMKVPFVGVFAQGSGQQLDYSIRGKGEPFREVEQQFTERVRQFVDDRAQEQSETRAWATRDGATYSYGILLQLEAPRISGKMLSPLRRFPRIAGLGLAIDLETDRLTADAWQQMSALTNVDAIQLKGRGLPAAKVAALQQALPGCRITVDRRP